MRLEQLTIENFKCFKARTSFDLALLGALQTEDFPFQYSPNGHFVKMGNFNEMVYKDKSNFFVGLKFEDYEYQTIWTKEHIGETFPKLNDFFFKRKTIEKTIALKNIEKNRYHYKIDSILNDDEKELELEDLPKISDYDTLKYNIKKLYSEKMNFVGSNRLSPERTYYQQAKLNYKIGVNGENYLDQIYDWQTNENPKLNELIRYLRELQILQEIRTVNLGSGRFEIRLKTNKGNIENALSDVGFGVSQFLPIIVADLQLSENSTLMIAQPEIHLHPSIQSTFGNYLAAQVNEAKKNYIIETHSEYLLNKIRLLIVKGDIAKEDVSVYFMEHDGVEAKAHKIIFSEDGQILNAPENFFKTYMMDVMDIAIQAAG